MDPKFGKDIQLLILSYNFITKHKIKIEKRRKKKSKWFLLVEVDSPIDNFWLAYRKKKSLTPNGELKKIS